MSNRSISNNNKTILNTTYYKILNNLSITKTLNFTISNESFIINMTKSTLNYTVLNHSRIVNGSDTVLNSTSNILNRDIDYTIKYHNGSFTLINITYNNTKLFISYNYTRIKEDRKGIWNWIDLYNCSNIFEIPYFYFASICNECYFKENQLDNYNVIIE